MLFLVYFQKIKIKNMSSKLKAQRFCTGSRSYLPMLVFWSLIFGPKTTFPYFIRFLSIIYMSCLKYGVFATFFKENWPIKLFLKLILLPYNWDSSNYKNQTSKLEKLKPQMCCLKLKKFLIKFFIIKTSFIYLKSSVPSLLINIIITYF